MLVQAGYVCWLRRENRRSRGKQMSTRESRPTQTVDGRSRFSSVQGALNALLPPFFLETKTFPEVIAWVTSVLRRRRDATEDLSQVRQRHVQAWPKPDFLLSHQKTRLWLPMWLFIKSNRITVIETGTNDSEEGKSTTSGEKKAHLNKRIDLFIWEDDSKPE